MKRKEININLSDIERETLGFERNETYNKRKKAFKKIVKRMGLTIEIKGARSFLSKNRLANIEVRNKENRILAYDYFSELSNVKSVIKHNGEFINIVLN